MKIIKKGKLIKRFNEIHQVSGSSRYVDVVVRRNQRSNHNPHHQHDLVFLYNNGSGSYVVYQSHNDDDRMNRYACLFDDFTSKS